MGLDAAGVAEGLRLSTVMGGASGGKVKVGGGGPGVSVGATTTVLTPGTSGDGCTVGPVGGWGAGVRSQAARSRASRAVAICVRPNCLILGSLSVWRFLCIDVLTKKFQPQIVANLVTFVILSVAKNHCEEVGAKETDSSLRSE